MKKIRKKKKTNNNLSGFRGTKSEFLKKMSKIGKLSKKNRDD